MDKDEVLDYIAMQYIDRKATKSSRHALAYVAFRVASGGMVPFPSQLKEIAPKLEERGEAAAKALSDAIRDSINKGKKK